MPKKQNKPIKTCADCIHEDACRAWVGGRYIADESANRCPNYETVKESGAYLCGVLDERNRKKTNADRIRNMSDEELAMCLYEIGYDRGWNALEGTLEWLKQPAEEADNEAD